ncbi:MAG: hypothetical protein P857_12 [Candidatus Xenolissoclinum pacificiensis L6]|uniref:DNA-directed RNA polymerase subunit omega n=1 Tax=Candidatus Xenolissoclinum pacificiensis L6 TaxID=1401685 RepID=W2V0C9_9RICK|nr:MAG: hypothetical protein P857_12 [Candidatus Xenolissoclinum pacificiensis L6]
MNHFEKVVVACSRAYQLKDGSAPMVECNKELDAKKHLYPDKESVIALEEVEKGLVDYDIVEEYVSNTLGSMCNGHFRSQNLDERKDSRIPVSSQDEAIDELSNDYASSVGMKSILDDEHASKEGDYMKKDFEK